jgi:hypothetical protein
MLRPSLFRGVLAFALVAGAAQAAPIAERDVRALVERQRQAWSQGNLDAYFATFASDARFTDQARGSDNAIVPYGSSSLAEARGNARRALAKGRIAEEIAIKAIAISKDGRGAAVVADVRTRIETPKGVRWSCAERIEAFAQLKGGLRAISQTDTLVRCRRAP